jgi:hypothetical protein
VGLLSFPELFIATVHYIMIRIASSKYSATLKDIARRGLAISCQRMSMSSARILPHQPVALLYAQKRNFWWGTPAKSAAIETLTTATLPEAPILVTSASAPLTLPVTPAVTEAPAQTLVEIIPDGTHIVAPVITAIEKIGVLQSTTTSIKHIKHMLYASGGASYALCQWWWTVTDDNFPIDFTYKSRPVILKDNLADLPQLCQPLSMTNILSILP